MNGFLYHHMGCARFDFGIKLLVSPVFQKQRSGGRSGWELKNYWDGFSDFVFPGS